MASAAASSAPVVRRRADLAGASDTPHRGLPGHHRDLGVSHLTEEAVLPPVPERAEKEHVERPPDSDPHEHPPCGGEHEVGVAGRAHQVAVKITRRYPMTT